MKAKRSKATNQLARKRIPGKGRSLCTSALIVSAAIGIGVTVNPERSWAGACAGVYSTRNGTGTTAFVGYFNRLTNSYVDVVTYNGGNNINAIATQPSTGNVFFVNRATRQVVVYNVNTESLTTLTGTLPNISATIVGATFLPNGRLYVYYNDKTLIEVNPATGSQIGSTITISGIPGGSSGTTNGDLAVGTDGTLYALGDTSASTSQFYSITISGTTATATPVNGNNNISGVNAANGLAIDPLNGKVYISSGTGTYELNPTTKVATQLTTVATITDLAACGSPTPDLPTITKAFSPTNVSGTPATSTLTLTLGNTNTVPIYTLQTLTDTLPSGLVVSSPNGLGGSCTAIAGNTVTAAAGSGSISFNSGFKIPAGGCTVTVNVTTNSAGSYVNNIPAGDLKTFAGDNATATSSTLTVTTPPVTVSGTVFSDADGSITINGSDAGTNAGSANLTVYAVDTAGNVVAKATVAANGTYSLTTVPANANVTLRLSNNSTVAVGATAPAAPSLPANWVNTGENKNGTTETITPGDIAVTTTTTNITNQNFGIEQRPTAVGGTATSQTNPGGTNTVTVASTLFTGSTDPDGTVASYRITAFPSNATSIRINGTNYTSASFPGAGVTVTTAQLAGMLVDPIDGAVTVGIPFQAIDNAGQPSSNTATASLPFSAAAAPVTVSGRVFSDADADVTINGSDAGTNAGSTSLTIYAIDTAGNVIDKATVAADGTYTFTNIPPNASVKLRLSNNATVTIGAPAPAAPSIPAGWFHTGENLNGTIDGAIATLGDIALTTTTANVTNQNFGIRQSYTIAPDPAPNTCNPDYRTALNTGITAAGGQLAVGANDLNWTAEWLAGPASGPGTPYAPPRPVGVMPAVVVGNLAPGAWVNEPANARWISYPFRLSVNSNGVHNDADLDGTTQEGNPSFSGPGTSDDVRLKFTSFLTLPSNANTVSISLPVGVAVDNQFVSIKVNGVENLVPTPAANPVAVDYGSFKNVNVTNGWQVGVNTIEVIVDSGPDRVGFLLGVQATSTQVCSTPVTINGTVFSDADGSITINGSDAGTNAGSANLTVYAIDTAGKVVDKATVAANGTYSLANVPGNASVTLRLSNDATVAVGATAPAAPSLPANWVNTGENKNGTTETTTPGDIAITTTTTNISNQNFGIEQLPNTTPINATAQANPGGTTTVQVPTLAGTDPEDGALGSGKSFKIVALPTNGTLTYNNAAVTAGQIITNYDPTLLKLDPNDGTITVTFSVAAIDAAGKEDPTPATVSMPFTGAGGTPQIVLVKRITANNGAAITTTVDDPGSPNDNAANWPNPVDVTTGISTYLKGATNGGTIRPGDVLEYTIYFLSNGGAAATNINLCDLVPSNSTFIPDSFSSSPESGINLTIGATTTNLTNVPDVDGGEFFNPGATPSIACSATNTNGAVVVNVVKSPATLPNATAPGTPSNSYGFIRFRARVN
ncbi:MAG: DUF11 domain-containing protein [Lyngbya sp. HA4199-MV5]|jgi:hypothetical protein|nr:DUF11 domain-containing protein [Lyngbya sp. HA4199-MV5]